MMKGIQDDEIWKPDSTFHSSEEEAVAVETAILAAVSHVRVERSSLELKIYHLLLLGFRIISWERVKDLDRAT